MLARYTRAIFLTALKSLSKSRSRKAPEDRLAIRMLPVASHRRLTPGSREQEGASRSSQTLTEDQRLLIIYCCFPFQSFFFKRPSADGHRWLCLTCTSSCFRELFEQAHAKSTRRTAADALVGPPGQRFSAHSPRGVTLLRAVPV